MSFETRVLAVRVVAIVGFGCISKVETTEFAYGSDVGCETKSKVKDEL